MRGFLLFCLVVLSSGSSCNYWRGVASAGLTRFVAQFLSESDGTFFLFSNQTNRDDGGHGSWDSFMALHLLFDAFEAQLWEDENRAVTFFQNWFNRLGFAPSRSSL